MPLHPWDFARVSFCVTSGVVGVEADCATCGRRVSVDLRSARPALRLGLAILDSDRGAKSLGDRAGVALDQVGGVRPFLRGLGTLEILVGELDRLGRIGLGIALDVEAESEALEREWGRAEELAAIMDGELTEVEGFREFRARVLSGSGSP
jgi:hypothetical protein